MSNTEYIVPGGGIVNDIESSSQIIIPGFGVYNEQIAAVGVNIPVFIHHYNQMRS